MKVLVTSDLHLSDRIWKHRPIEGDSYAAWQAIVRYALDEDNEIDEVIIAGDILDKQTNQSTAIHHLTVGLSSLIEAGIRVYFNQGQHCMQEKPWPSLVDGVRHLKFQDMYNVGGLMMTGFDYCSREQLQENLKDESVAKADILVCHQVWEDFMGGVGNPQGCFEDIPDNVKYLITGDYHENICKRAAQPDIKLLGLAGGDETEGLVVISPGSTHLRSISEPDDKYFWVVEIADGTSPHIHSVEIPGRRRFELKMTAWDGVQAVFPEALDHAIRASLEMNENYWDGRQPELIRDIGLGKPLIRIVHNSDQLDTACNSVISKYAEDAHFFYKIVRPEAENDLDVLEYVDASDRLKMIDCLDTAVDQKERPLAHSLATALLSGGEPEQVLQKWIKEQVNEGS
jgi:hypothetical protein